jgi:hypothetical protein
MTASSARRDYIQAADALADAEALLQLLERNPLVGNSYYINSYDRTCHLVAELSERVDEVVARYGREACGLA